ncbi:MAG TPA: GNAT family N-acetyltransferase [Acidimicrobiales bacterium]|nr:GNAT family N-acetyltransferase [Acidimicrobiales bacterium]
MSEVEVRRARPEDVDAIVDLFVAVVDEGRWLGTEPPVDRAGQRERFLEHIDGAARGASVVAVAGDEIVGHARVDLAPYNVAGLGMMVHPGWRGRGVGGALVDTIIEASRQLGAHKIALQVWPHNQAALRLYRRHGFVEEGVLRRHYPRRNGQLWDAVIMGLVLDETAPGSPFPA